VKSAPLAILCFIACGQTSTSHIDTTGEQPQDARGAIPIDAGQAVDTPMVAVDALESGDALEAVDALVPTDTNPISLDSTVPPDGSTIDAGSQSCAISLIQSGVDPALISVTLEVHCTAALVTSIISVFDGRTLLVQDPSPRACGSSETIPIRLRSAPSQLSAGASFMDIHGLRFSCATH
jgi:hypothetical protein